MTKTHVTIDPGRRRDLSAGRVNDEVLDATTERDSAAWQHQDDARRVRKRLGFTQHEFARRIDVSQDTVRSWEQGKRRPTDAVKTLLRVLERHPRRRCSCCAEAVTRAARAGPSRHVQKQLITGRVPAYP